MRTKNHAIYSRSQCVPPRRTPPCIPVHCRAGGRAADIEDEVSGAHVWPSLGCGQKHLQHSFNFGFGAPASFMPTLGAPQPASVLGRHLGISANVLYSQRPSQPTLFTANVLYNQCPLQPTSFTTNVLQGAPTRNPTHVQTWLLAVLMCINHMKMLEFRRTFFLIR